MRRALTPTHLEVCQLPLLLLGLVVCVSPLQAKKKHHHDQDDSSTAYSPPPNEAFPAVSPDALPSASLQPFLDTHLDRILAPLGKEEFNQPWIVASLKSSYATILTAAPANRKPAFAAAENVCDALTCAMAERQKAVDAWHGSSATHSSEGDQPRGGHARAGYPCGVCRRRDPSGCAGSHRSIAAPGESAEDRRPQAAPLRSR